MGLTQKLQKTQETIRRVATHRKDKSAEARRDRRKALIGLLVTAMVVGASGIDSAVKKSEQEAFQSSIESDDFWLRAMAGTLQSEIFSSRAETLLLTVPSTAGADGPERLEAMAKEWRAEAARLTSSPKTGDGVREMSDRARKAEVTRNLMLWQMKRYTFAVSALHIGIFTASASLVTGLPALAVVGTLSGLAGFALGGYTFWQGVTLPALF